MAITITEAAANEVKQLFETQKIDEGTFLRMAIAGGGCSGLQYSLGLDTEFAPDVDTEFTENGVRIVAGKEYALHLDGTIVDFKDGPFGRGFTIENPNYPSTGGCAGCGGH